MAIASCLVAIAAAQGTDSKPLRLTSKHHWYSGELKVSVNRTDVTSRRLLTTARALQAQTKATGVHFFLDRHAAEAFTFFEPEPPPGNDEAARHHLAIYSHLGRAAFAITPFGWDGPWNAVTLNTDSSGVVRCQYELDGRCLLGLKPMDVDLTDLTGTVTLTATLAPAGVLSGARVVEVNAQDEAQRARLAEAVRRNLPSWWVDPGNRSVGVRITYAVGSSVIVPTENELDLEYPRSGTPADLDRLGPGMRAQHRRSHFRVTAAVAPR